MGAFLQTSWREAPAPILAGNHCAQHGVAVIDRHRGSRFRRAVQGGRRIVGQIPALQLAGVLCNIVRYLRNAGCRRSGIDGQFKRRRTFAHVPGFVRYRSAQAVGTFLQTSWREAPASILAGNHCAQHGVAVIDRHRGSRFRRAVQGGRRIVGKIPALQLAGVLCDIVGYLRNAGCWRSGIDGQFKRRRTFADVAGFVRHRRAQAMGTLAQLR